MPNHITFGLLAACIALSGCGGGATTGNGGPVIQPPPIDTTPDTDRGARLLQETGRLVALIPTLSRTSLADVNGLGSAEYRGRIGIREFTPGTSGDLFGAVGELAINYDFPAGQRSGSAANFYQFLDPNDANITPDDIRAIDGNFSLGTGTALTGTLTKLNGEVANYALTLEASDASLLGPGGQLFVGLADGQSTAAGRAGTAAEATLTAEKQP